LKKWEQKVAIFRQGKLRVVKILFFFQIYQKSGITSRSFYRTKIEFFKQVKI